MKRRFLAASRPSKRLSFLESIMDGVVCMWSSPPSPEAIAGEERTFGSYHPGEIFNCRCLALPVVALEDLRFPVRVCMGGAKIVAVRSLAQMHGLAKA